jgi:hypothetical protein
MWIATGPSSGNGAPALHCSLTLWSGPRVELTMPKAEAFISEAERIQQSVHDDHTAGRLAAHAPG